ncbi:trypsin-like serine protease [Leisingera sp. D0M16]|uniref:trypsin-like serine protease n=1 Tax=Leisingera coralii TaxID=3351347 RepID=UPI003B7AD10A
MPKLPALLVTQVAFVFWSLGPALSDTLLITDDIPIEEPVPQAAYDDPEETTEEEIPEPDPGYTVTVFEKAPKGLFSGVARLLYKKQGRSGEFGCSATLIAPQILLTAQHCVRNIDGKLHKYIKAKFPKSNSSGSHTQEVKLSSSNTALHIGGLEKRTDGTLRWSQTSDLALVRLEKPVPDAENRIIPLLQKSQINSHSLKMFVGYGMQYINYQTERVGGSRALGWITSDVVPMKITSGNYAKRSFLVAGEAEIGGNKVSVALCNGDSGGPFLVANPEHPSSSVLIAGVNHAVLYGLAPEACAKPGNVSYLVGILGNMDFINAGIEKLQN